MRVSWLKQTGSCEVIVVFGGWGIGPACFAHLAGGQDVLFVSDYRDLSAALPELGGYARRSLVAWSFGVAAFGHWRNGLGQDLLFDRRVAVNGSLTPVHPRMGIAPRVFRNTVDGLSAVSFQEFLQHSFDAPHPPHQVDVAALRDELIAVEQRGPAPECDWDRVWISGRDRIFPPQNLERAWAHRPDAIRRIDAPHVPFAAWATWAQVLE